MYCSHLRFDSARPFFSYECGASMDAQTTVVIVLIDFSASCELPTPNWLRRLLLSLVCGLARCLGIKFRAVLSVSERHVVGGQKITVPVGVRLLAEGEQAQLASPTKWLALHHPVHASRSRN